MDKRKESEGKPGLEENFAYLEEVMGRLEAQDITLEDAFAAYSRGMEILKDCNAQIDKVEKKVLMLSGDGTFEILDEP